jgi:hypothetical protein
MAKCTETLYRGGLSLSKTYLRVAYVRRPEYLIALLESFQDDSFDEKLAEQLIRQTIYSFAVEKAKALGRQRPRVQQGASTLQECIRLAMDLRLIDRNKRRTADAYRILNESERRPLLLERMWETYPRFSQVVLLARDYGQLDLPLYDWEAASGQEVIDKYGLGLARFQFDILREFTTYLGLLNWHPSARNRQIVYPVATVVLRSEISSEHLTEQEDKTSIPDSGEYLTLNVGTEQVFVKEHSVSTDDFEQSLWGTYLALTDMRARFPILYPELRNRVCASLRISDQAFDREVLSLIEKPNRLNIYPSGGILSYSANLAYLGKLLPVKNPQGDFITYLKIDRRATL